MLGCIPVHLHLQLATIGAAMSALDQDALPSRSTDHCKGIFISTQKANINGSEKPTPAEDQDLFLDCDGQEEQSHADKLWATESEPSVNVQQP